MVRGEGEMGTWVGGPTNAKTTAKGPRAHISTVVRNSRSNLGLMTVAASLRKHIVPEPRTELRAQDQFVSAGRLFLPLCA